MKAKVIDAAHLEGGGQVVRIAVALSALTSKPIELRNIRGNRSGGGGLKGQHLTAIQWLARACNASIQGLELKSQTLLFEPGRGNTAKQVTAELVQPVVLESGKRALETTVNLETNGAATLVLQTLLPYLIFCPPTRPGFDRLKTPIVLTIRGGTNVPLSPSIDYLLKVFSPNLARMGIRPLELVSLQRGYTTGARSALGSVSVLIHPLPSGSHLPRLALPRLPTDTSSSPDHALVRQPTATMQSISIHILAPSKAAIAALRAAALSSVRTTFFPDLALPLSPSSTILAKPPGDEPPRIQIYASSSSDTANKRFYLLLAATHASGWVLGADWLYDGRGAHSDGRRQRGTEAVLSTHVLERVVKEMTDRVVGELKALVDEGRAIDRWMEDQVVVFGALAGRSGAGEDDGGEALARLSLDNDGAAAGGLDVDDAVSESVGRGEPSLHTVTARWIAKELLGVEFDDTGYCEGVGLEAV